MNRRKFLQHSGRTLAAVPMYSLASGLVSAGCTEAPAPAAAPAVSADVMNRIAMTTVCLRSMFPKSMNLPGVSGDGGTLTLLQSPKFMADTFGIHTVETWNWQFAEQTMDYCQQLKAAAAAAGSKFNNLQLDLGPEDNLSDPDASKRAATIKIMKEWIDRTATIGATSMRANTGFGTEANWNLQRTAAGFKELTDYGKTKGVMILIENHIGYGESIDRVVEIIKAVNDPNCRAICDWGNTPANGTPPQKIDALAKLFPYLHLVSAKQLDFDANNQHISYDIVPIIQATEASGFKGVYSIEFYTEKAHPTDYVAALKEEQRLLAANIKA